MLGRGDGRAPRCPQQHSRKQTRKISVQARIALGKEKQSTGLGRGGGGGEPIFFFPTENPFFLFSPQTARSLLWHLTPQ